MRSDTSLDDVRRQIQNTRIYLRAWSVEQGIVGEDVEAIIRAVGDISVDEAKAAILEMRDELHSKANVSN